MANTKSTGKKVEKNTARVNELLEIFGLTEKEQMVYVLLIERGWSTALQLTHHIEIKRTSLYRVLEALVHKGLVMTQLDDTTTYYAAADPQQFESLVLEQEKKAQVYRQTFVALQPELQKAAEVKQGDTAVRLFRGKRGLEHMMWRVCEGKAYEVLILGSEQWDDELGNDFAEQIRSEMVKQKITIREIINTVSNKGKLAETEDVDWTENKVFANKYWQGRYIDPKILKISQEVLIYQNVIQFQGYKNNDLMGIEIESVEYSEMFRQWFEVLWGLAGKL